MRFAFRALHKRLQSPKGSNLFNNKPVSPFAEPDPDEGHDVQDAWWHTFNTNATLPGGRTPLVGVERFIELGNLIRDFEAGSKVVQSYEGQPQHTLPLLSRATHFMGK